MGRKCRTISNSCSGCKSKSSKGISEDVCGFGAGEPDFDTPSFIKEACMVHYLKVRQNTPSLESLNFVKH